MTVSAPAAMALTMSPEYVTPPSAMTGTSSCAGPARGEPDGRQLRHAGAADDAGGADGTGADADLDGVGTGRGQRLDALLGDDVAGDDGQRRPRRLDPLDGLDDAGRVAVGGVDRDGVDAHGEQRLDAVLEIGADADGRRAPQPPARVAGGVGELVALLDVLHRDEAAQEPVGVDQRQLLDAMLLQHGLGLLERGADLGGDQTRRTS